MKKALFIFLLLPAILFSQTVRNNLVKDITVRKGAWYDIRAYGAIAGDDINDRAYIQAAIDSASNDGGGTVFIPGGTWDLVQDSVVVKSNVNILGVGSASIVQVTKSTSASFEAFRIDDQCNITLSDFKILGDLSPADSVSEFDHAVSILDSAYNITVERLNIQNIGGDGVYVGGTDAPLDINILYNTIVGDSVASASSRNGVAIVNGKRIEVVGNKISGFTVASIDLEPNASQNIYDVNLYRNIIEQSYRYGISVGTSVASYIERVNISGNIIKHTNRDAICVASGHASMFTNLINVIANEIDSCNYYGTTYPSGIRVQTKGYAVNISDNLISNMNSSVNPRGIIVRNDSTLNNVKISGNQLKNINGIGIVLNGTTSNIKNFNISDNIVQEFGYTGYSFNRGIQVLVAENGMVSNNVVSDTSGFGNYGIEMGSCDSVVVINNALTGLTLGGAASFRDAGSNANVFYFGNIRKGTKRPDMGHGRFHSQTTTVQFPGTADTYYVEYVDNNDSTVAKLTATGNLTIQGRGAGNAGNVVANFDADTTNGHTDIELHTNVGEIKFYQRSTGWPVVYMGAIGLNTFMSPPDTLLGTIWRDANQAYIMGRNKANGADSVHVLYDFTP